MTTIPDTFNKFGYVFNIVKRTPRVAIYEQTKGWRVYAYEVHRIRVRKAGIQFGKDSPASEYLASDRDWGMWAKTYSASLYNRDGARTRADAQHDHWSGLAAKAA